MQIHMSKNRIIKCFLQALEEDKYLSIELKNGVKTILGRSPLTKIEDKKCSKSQVEVIPNFSKGTLLVKQTGPNNSAVNGKLLGLGIEETIKESDILEILAGQHKFKVSFEKDRKVEDTSSSSNSNSAVGQQNGPKPAKIPKMFQPKSAFMKDSLMKKGSWQNIDYGKLMVYVSETPAYDLKDYVGMFDLDGTIIKTKSGKVFPRDDNDWQFMYSTTILRLQNFFSTSKKHKFVIFTNQAGLSTGNTAVESFKKKIENIVREIDIPTIVLVAPTRDHYRKPITKGWDAFVKEFNGELEPGKSESFFCGDAAGRKKDHSKSDRLFAINVDIPFKTPEEFFLGQKQQEFSMPIFNPKKLVEEAEKGLINNDHFKLASNQEMIIMVGYPASGKSSFVKNEIVSKGYVHINRDTLKTQLKCISETDKALTTGQSVVIDNTNPGIKERAEYIKLAKKHDVPVRCLKMNIEHAHALHNNKFRQLNSETNASVPEVAFNTFKAHFKEPNLNEGMDEIIGINFIPSFKLPNHKELYVKYLLEK